MSIEIILFGCKVYTKVLNAAALKEPPLACVPELFTSMK
jgi:hypothetical protein